MKLLFWLLTVIQVALALRFARHLVASAGGEKIHSRAPARTSAPTSVIVPVLNEVDRLAPCLKGLASQDECVTEILIIDGGSSDGTQNLVRTWMQRDSRIRLIQVDQIPNDWNGKAWGLQCGLLESSNDSDWFVTIDADVRCATGAIGTAIGFAGSRWIDALSITCEQIADTRGLSLVHPSLLATLVYRFGMPGTVATRLSEVQSNGQFSLYRREALERGGGFFAARDSICEDVTIARHLFLIGEKVGFFEGPGLAQTAMYASGTECLSNWPRSLTLRDRVSPNAGMLGLANLIFLQVIPLVLILIVPRSLSTFTAPRLVNRVLIGTRLGILVGTRRAYVRPVWSYWLSPLFDPVTLATYLFSLLRGTHSWRGRVLVGDRTNSPRESKGVSSACV